MGHSQSSYIPVGAQNGRLIKNTAFISFRPSLLPVASADAASKERRGQKHMIEGHVPRFPRQIFFGC